MSGGLFIVATPIGNLKDISLRAMEALKAADVIACEDTRHAAILLKAHGIATPTASYHSHSGPVKTEKILEQLQSGKKVALISDAGTPGISDPGTALIHQAIALGVDIQFIPGPSAVLAAVVLSGFPTDRFVFEGFLPVKPGARRTRLETIKEEQRTVVVYEAPHRMLKLLEEVEEVFGNIPLSVSRELTKMFEETRRDSVSQLRAHFSAHPPKGEFVVTFPPQRLRQNGQ